MRFSPSSSSASSSIVPSHLSRHPRYGPLPLSPLCRLFHTTTSYLSRPLPPRPPLLPASEIESSALKGSGPGGQKINKSNTAIQLKHLPTGIVVKSQATRSRSQNMKIAQRLLADEVDVHLNGENSRKVIVGRILAKKRERGDRRRRLKYEERKAETMRQRGEGEGLEDEDAIDIDEDEEEADLLARLQEEQEQQQQQQQQDEIEENPPLQQPKRNYIPNPPPSSPQPLSPLLQHSKSDYIPITKTYISSQSSTATHQQTEYRKPAPFTPISIHTRGTISRLLPAPPPSFASPPTTSSPSAESEAWMTFVPTLLNVRTKSLEDNYKTVSGMGTLSHRPLLKTGSPAQDGGREGDGKGVMERFYREIENRRTKGESTGGGLSKNQTNITNSKKKRNR